MHFGAATVDINLSKARGPELMHHMLILWPKLLRRGGPETFSRSKSKRW